MDGISTGIGIDPDPRPTRLFLGDSSLARRMTDDLGVFSAAELRAGGINSRGFLQPLLPPPEGVDQEAATQAATEDLASKGLLRRGPSGFRPVGRYERVLEAAAVARSLLAVGPADPAVTGFGQPRLVLGCLGSTDWVLDLCPESAGYRARLMTTPDAAGEVAGWVEGLAGREAGSPTGDTAPPLSVSECDPEWAAVEAFLRRGVATVRIEAASISRPAGPLLQHRLTMLSTDDGDWLLIGTRNGARSARQAGPIDRDQLTRLLEDALNGLAIAL